MNVASPQPLSPDLYNHALECGVIGAVLLYPGVYTQVQPVLKPAHFHERFLGEVYEWIGQQHVDGAIAGDALQWACLTSVSHIDKGKETIAHCIAVTVVPAHLPYAVSILLALAERRRLLAAAEQIAGQAHVGSATLLADAIDLVIVENEEPGRRSEFSIGEAFAAIGERAKVRRAYSGSAALDKRLGGWQSGRFYVMGGRPGSGKTTLALSLLLRTAEHGHGVGFFSLEMSAHELAARAAADLAYSSTSVIPYRDIERGALTPFQRAEVADATGRFKELRFVINDRAAPMLGELKMAVQALKRRFEAQKKTLDVIAVDHLGLIKPSGDYRGNKVAEIGEVSAGLKAIAKDLDVAVIAVCQLNREVEGRDNKRPTLADLRWAGEIEQDADVVLMVYREAYYLDEDSTDYHAKKNRMEVLIRKNRSGETGKIEMFVEMAAAHVKDHDWRH